MRTINDEQLKNCIIPKLGVLQTDDFSRIYPTLNEIINSNENSQASRNGETKEFLNFKTILTNPYKRNVGGRKRNMNVFFFLAEAMWIFVGKKDVEFLNIFNSNMKTFSDDGLVFHAPYGFRLRNWGIRSEDKYETENLHASQGFDQIYDIVKLLSENPDSRQAVAQIWNPDFDLGVKSKDIPCNDTLMFKIRNGELHTTIQNRSNDLHWGLPTNIFQFSFLSEVISMCLGVRLGTQVHNSQSLHVYDWNETSKTLQENKDTDSDINLYEYSEPKKIDCKFLHTVPNNRLVEIDSYFNGIIQRLLTLYKTGEVNDEEFQRDLYRFSKYFTLVYVYLKIYVRYKLKEITKEQALEMITELPYVDTTGSQWDVQLLAQNFFGIRIDNYENEVIGKL